ncbi:MAG: CCA tRNA nucleotidyltransferase [Elusimicrobia bacterium]|nr:CCA tRNA nucleotidyltransferase [Elusimicrobiota bacterium]
MKKISVKNLSVFTRRERNVLEGISELAGRLGRKAYLVGGFARDIILSRENTDIDCVVEGDVLDFARHLAEKFGGKLAVSRKFRTAKVDFGGFSVDFAQARKETYPFSGALPEVSPGSLREDVFRRDFTINAIYISLNRENLGEVLCRLCVNDLKKGIIRVFHSKSFLDDPTRILRAVRFASRFGFAIEASTRQQLKSAVAEGALSKISPFRLKREFFLILREADVVKPVRKLLSLGALKDIMPGLKKADFGRLADAQKTWFEFYIYLPRDFNTPLYYTLVIAGNLPRKIRERICRRLAFTKKEESAMLSDFRIVRKIVSDIEKGGKNWSVLADGLPVEVILLVASLLSREVKQKRKLFEYLTSVRFKKIFHTNRELLRMGIPAGNLGGQQKDFAFATQERN